MEPLIITVALAGTPEAATADFVCDGIDDDVEINAALAQAGAAGGGIVRLAPGNYSTGLPIVVYDDNVSIEGDPAGGTAIRPDAYTWVSQGTPDGGLLTGAVNFVGVDNFAARFLTVEYTHTPDAPPDRIDLAFNGIQAIPTGADGAGAICTNGVFEGNTIRCAPGHTYSLWSLRSEGMQIIDNLIEGGATVAQADSSQEGIEIFGGSDILISGNTITGMGNAAIQLGGLAETTPDCSVDNVTVTGNSISNSRVGLFIGTTYGSVGGAADVTNILIENNDFQALFEAGLMIRNWTGSPVDPPELSNIVFRDNDVNLVTAAGSGYTPVAVWLLDLTGAGNSVTSGVIVENNDFSTTTVAAVPPPFWLAPGYNVLILIQDFEGASITGNGIEMADSSAVSRAIAVTGSSEIAITGNAITGAGLTPIEFYQSHDFIIDANTIADWGQSVPGILVGEAADYSITGNILHGAGGEAANMIAVYASGAATSLAGNVRVADADATLAGSLFQNLQLTGSAVSGTGNELDNSILGNAQNNILDGGAGADILDGGAGDDRLTGGAGDDRFAVDSPGDLVTEEADGGIDQVTASIDYVLAAHVEWLVLTGTALNGTGNDLDNLITGNELANLLDGGAGVDLLAGGLGDDHYRVDNALDIVSELEDEGDDLVTASVDYQLSAHVERLTLIGDAVVAFGNGLANIITGNAGDNVLDGGEGVDQLVGGLGNDEYVVDDADDQLIELEGEGDDLVRASVNHQLAAHVERLVLTGAAVSGTGNALANAITGNEFDNLLDGGDGNDLLDGGTGADMLIGGLGDDGFIVDDAGDQVIELADGGTDTVFARVSYTLAKAAKIERLHAEDPGGIAALVLFGNGEANEIRGNAGDNVLHGAGGSGDVLIGLGGNDIYYTDVATTVIVEAQDGGNDALYTSVSYTLSSDAEVELLSTNSTSATSAINLIGNTFNQILVGNAGNNLLHGGGGTDTLYGFGGDDTYFTDVASTQIVEALDGGNDALYTSVSYTLARGMSVELLSTNSHAATTAINLIGNNLDQILVGNAGNNLLHGGGGIDTLYGFGGNDIYYTDVAETVVMEADGAGDDALYTSASYVLRADASVEILSTNFTAGTGAIDLTGSNFANLLAGNDGANVLDGKGANDILYGYGGADTFQFSSALGEGNIDLIADFQHGVDRIALDDAIFTAIGGPGALNASAFVTGSAATDPDDRIIYNSATGQLFYDADANGAGAAVLFATLQGAPPLTASDFMVI